ncbi:MAG: magnesium transporter [Ruminococcaceae bacterium]|nr:magnesium transporter [Oscillospiraceae bacterium]
MNQEQQFDALLEQIQDLLNSRRYLELRDLFSEQNPADIALLLEELPVEKLPLVFRILPKEDAAEVFAYFESDAQEQLIKAFSDRELKEVLDELYIDDTVDLIEEMPANVVRRILAVAPQDMRSSINQILQYPDDSAGSIMTTEFIHLQRDMTVEDAFMRIRRTGVDKETIYTCYVTESDRKLIGIVTVKTLLLSESDALIEEIMEDNVISVTTHEDQESTAQLFNKYDFLALPVVDTENRLVGIITVDDAIDVLQDEATEDIEKMAGISPTDKPYLKTSTWKIYLTRIPWLTILMLTATISGYIISAYESALISSGMVMLTSFVPMLMNTAGNSGSQSSVTVTRGISIGEIEFSDLLSVIWKEFRVSLLCGITLAIVSFLKMLFLDRVELLIALAISLTLIVAVLFAKVIGCSLPMLAKKIHLDPAVMASPFITTIVDALTLIVYFNIASSILGI